MKALSFLAAFGFLISSLAHATPAPPEDRKPTYLISDKAHALIDPLDARSMADDETFIKTLKDVLKTPDFTDADKADAFFLMRMKFDWAFIGAASIPPTYTYDRVLWMYHQTYLDYHKALGNEYDVNGLLELAKLSEPEQIVRASSALLLAAVIDPAATRNTVIELCDPRFVSKSVAPPIVIHHLALCAALCDVGDDGFTKLAELASKFPFEESQEDILLALAFTNRPHTLELIETFAEQNAPKKFDLAVQFALTVVRWRMEPQEFQEWVQPLADSAEDKETKESILEWSKAKPGPVGPMNPDGGWLKIWDGFDAIIYDDGTQLKYGDKFSGFMSR